MKQNFYLTTTLPYVNAEPHIGFALEIIQADAIARFQRLLGNEVIFNTGTDEHGLKIYRKALENNEEPQAYCDRYAQKFDDLKILLNLSYTNFIRTTDEHHVKAAQEFWRRCLANGDIYKKIYKVKYCVGCEMEKTDSELVDDKCPVHPNLAIELIEEDNYFFKFSKYQESLLKLYRDNPNFVVPENRLLEITNFVASGLEDFSISRLKSKMPWGVSVPDDDEQVMYVWFDALVNYISTLGWSNDEAKFKDFWPGIQVAGKDNLRPQSAMWQAMLMSANLPNSKQIFIHGFITSGGQKMSKSLGNVVNPVELVNKYGADPVRYFLLGGLPSYEDGDYTSEKFEEFYTAHLANGIGNLTARVLTMVEKYCANKAPASAEDIFDVATFWDNYEESINAYKFEEVVRYIDLLVKNCDLVISEQKPWEKAKAGENISSLLYQLIECLRHLGLALLPIIPATGEKILVALGVDYAKKLINWETEKQWGGLKEGSEIKKTEMLFPRLKQI